MRAALGIIYSFRKLITVILFFVALIFLYAFIGVKIIGDLDGRIEYDEVFSILIKKLKYFSISQILVNL